MSDHENLEGEDSEHEYSPSPSPEEDWGDDDTEWTIEGIVGESIDALRQKRYEALHAAYRPSMPLFTRS